MSVTSGQEWYEDGYPSAGKLYTLSMYSNEIGVTIDQNGVAFMKYPAPSGQPTTQPSGQPTSIPSGQPTMQPSSQPSGSPTTQPSSQPSSVPSSQPSGKPTGQPTALPSDFPRSQDHDHRSMTVMIAACPSMRVPSQGLLSGRSLYSSGGHTPSTSSMVNPVAKGSPRSVPPKTLYN